jgi:hypothetical protein
LGNCLAKAAYKEADYGEDVTTHGASAP